MPEPFRSLPLGEGRLGLGLAALGRPGYINVGHGRDFAGKTAVDSMKANAHAVLDAAYEAGVRYFDAARSYGRAEEFLGTWLAQRGLGPDDVTVGSKWGYRYTADWRVDAAVHEQKELSLERFRTQLAESRALLGERIDLYQIHSATAESGCLRDAALLSALVEGRHAGAYRAVGLTLSGATSDAALAQALDAQAGGERVFDVVQATFNVLEPSLAGGLARAHAAGMGVIAKEVFANGRLTDANDRPEDAALLRRLRAHAAQVGLALDQLAVAFVLAHPFVDVALSGAATTAQLASHVAAARRPPDPALAATLRDLAEPPATYWRTRSALPWT